MDTITLKQMSEYTTYHLPFKNSNETVFAKEPPNPFEGQDLYVVYSYGEHFPIYVYDYQSEMWFGNDDKYSPTTSKHQTMAEPEVDDIQWLTTEELNQIIYCGGYRNYCSDRCGVILYRNRINISDINSSEGVAIVPTHNNKGR
tara:strand:+ start:208 stop:639 length:432 start_codon:yes stop_codon:yes gene_type:complete